LRPLAGPTEKVGALPQFSGKYHPRGPTSGGGGQGVKTGGGWARALHGVHTATQRLEPKKACIRARIGAWYGRCAGTYLRLLTDQGDEPPYPPTVTDRMGRARSAPTQTPFLRFRLGGVCTDRVAGTMGLEAPISVGRGGAVRMLVGGRVGYYHTPPGNLDRPFHSPSGWFGKVPGWFPRRRNPGFEGTGRNRRGPFGPRRPS